MWIDFYKKPHRRKQRISFGKESGGGGETCARPPRIQNFPNYAETGRAGQLLEWQHVCLDDIVLHFRQPVLGFDVRVFKKLLESLVVHL